MRSLDIRTVPVVASDGSVKGVIGMKEVIDNSIDLSKVGSTRMMCHDMTTETLMLQALQQVKTFKTDKNTKLMLTDQNGKTVIELKKKQ